MKFIFERLVSKDFEKVYYVITEPAKDRITIYSQDIEELEKIVSSENKAEAYFELYTKLLKTTREEVDYEYLEWKIPVYSSGVSFTYMSLQEERKKRRLAGLRTQVRLAK